MRKSLTMLAAVLSLLAAVMSSRVELGHNKVLAVLLVVDEDRLFEVDPVVLEEALDVLDLRVESVVEAGELEGFLVVPHCPRL